MKFEDANKHTGLTIVEDEQRKRHVARQCYGKGIEPMYLYRVFFLRKVYDQWQEGTIYVLAPSSEEARQQAECAFDKEDGETYWGRVEHVPFLIRGWSNEKF